MRWLIVLLPCLCFAQTQQIHISAVVPPRPCDIEAPCKPISENVKPYVVTSATVSVDAVQYVGNKPAVSIQGNVKTVLF
jgi:hypothetical protein